MFLIDSIKPNVETKIIVRAVGRVRNKTSVRCVRVRFGGDNKNYIQNKREMFLHNETIIKICLWKGNIEKKSKSGNRKYPYKVDHIICIVFLWPKLCSYNFLEKDLNLPFFYCVHIYRGRFRRLMCLCLLHIVLSMIVYTWMLK